MDIESRSSEIDLWGRSRPGLYAGVDIDRNRQILLVYRRPSASFDIELRGAFPELHIETISAPASIAELDGLIAEVLADARYWAGRGIYIAGAAPDFVTGTVVVDTPQADAARLLFRARYDGKVAAVEGNAVPAPFSVMRDQRPPR